MSLFMKSAWKNRSLLMAALLGIVCFSGCQTTPKPRTTMEHMEQELIKGAGQDRILQSQEGVLLPDHVRKCMVPNMMMSPRAALPYMDRRFDIFADQVPARSFFLGLVKDTPYNISVPPTVVGSISLQLKKVTIGEILETVRNVYGYGYRRNSSGFEILPATLQTQAFKINYLDLDRKGKSEIRVSAGGLRSSTQGSGSVITPVAATGGAEGEQQQVTNSRIVSTSNSDFWDELKATIEAMIGSGQGRRVAISPMSGLVVVQAFPGELRKVDDFLKKAELTINRQVILEAKILEVELNESFQAGVNWSLLTGRLRATEFGGEVARVNPVVGEKDFPPLTNNLIGDDIALRPGRQGLTRFIESPFDSGRNVGSFGGVFALAMNYKNLATFVELLGAQGKVQVLSSPRISTMNNQKALIKVGKDQFFITNISTTTTAIGTTASTTPNVTFDPFFSGIALDVTPSINDCDEITLHVHPAVSDVEDEVKTFVLNGVEQSVPLAASTVRESDSMVRAKNGQMVVIGGLMQDNTAKVREGIPFLKDLPVLGYLFGHTVQKTKKSELVILLRPIVMDDNAWSEKMEENVENFHKLNVGCRE